MNLLVCMFILQGTEPGGCRSVHVHTLKKGGRKGIVSATGRLENDRTAFVFSFCREWIRGEGTWGCAQRWERDLYQRRGD